MSGADRATKTRSPGDYSGRAFREAELTKRADPTANLSVHERIDWLVTRFTEQGEVIQAQGEEILSLRAELADRKADIKALTEWGDSATADLDSLEDRIEGVEKAAEHV